MPELPEMQALAERLDAAFRGSLFVRAEPLHFASLKTFEIAPESLAGATLEGVARRGKYAILEFGDRRIPFHLSQGGRVDLEQPAKKTRPKFGVVRFVFESGAAMVKEFGTERKAGWWVLRRDDEGPLARLGVEPFDVAFENLIMREDDKRRLHTMLRDQRTIAGIGRGYSDDILHAARLSPFGSLSSLDEARRHVLLDAVRTTLTEGLEAERQRTGGLPTKIGDHFSVHARYGEPCPRCGADLRRVSYESHEVTYCPPCQTGGKILADRRMSRLVK